ncbi:hypothetical protein X980_6042 [Burkholderia pseudomallei MSHR4000]|nr:hypothetical protein X980_6042 [Burkholderia pseudomallei MSHR4000]
MSELVRIAPGVVFSSKVLGVEWARKHLQDDGYAERQQKAGSNGAHHVPREKSDSESAPPQMSLL